MRKTCVLVNLPEEVIEDIEKRMVKRSSLNVVTIKKFRMVLVYVSKPSCYFESSSLKPFLERDMNCLSIFRTFLGRFRILNYFPFNDSFPFKKCS